MLSLAGFSHHAPDEIGLMLLDQGCPEGKVLTYPNIGYVTLMNSVDTLRRSGLDDGIVFVFDNDINLSRVVDWSFRDTTLNGSDFVPFEFSEIPKLKSVELKFQEFSIVDAIALEISDVCSFLKRFMTFIYTLPSSTHQRPITEAVCTWMRTTQDVNELLKSIKSELQPKQVARLTSLVTDANACLYRQALNDACKEPEQLAVKYKVSAYELSYIISKSKG